MGSPTTPVQAGRAEKQRRGHQSSGRLDHLTELQLWQRALTHINVARRKAGECSVLSPPSAGRGAQGSTCWWLQPYHAAADILLFWLYLHVGCRVRKIYSRQQDSLAQSMHAVI